MKKGRRSREKRGGRERWRLVAPVTKKRFGRRITGHRDPTPADKRQGHIEDGPL